MNSFRFVCVRALICIAIFYVYIWIKNKILKWKKKPWIDQVHGHTPLASYVCAYKRNHDCWLINFNRQQKKHENSRKIPNNSHILFNFFFNKNLIIAWNHHHHHLHLHLFDVHQKIYKFLNDCFMWCCVLMMRWTEVITKNRVNYPHNFFSFISFSHTHNIISSAKILSY